MKILILLLISTSVFCSDLFIKLDHSKVTFNDLIKPLWANLNYNIDLKESTFTKDNSSLNDSISYKLNSGNILLNDKKAPLFLIQNLGSNKLKLTWNLDKLKAKLEAKLRFKFKKLGVSITHDEKFKIDASNISGASTEIQILKSAESINDLKIRILKNTGFNLANIKIKPKNGIGSVLKYIFDNVFSKKKVNDYIKNKINAEVSKWINKNTILKAIERVANTQINKILNSPLDFKPLATTYKQNLKQLKIEPNNFVLETSFKDQFNYPIHDCANLISSTKSSDINISKNLIENILTNLSIRDNKSRQPLLCFGYHKLDDKGAPEGIEVVTKYLGKKIKFKFWVKPLSLPKFEYNNEKKLISVSTPLKVYFKSLNYPKLILNKDRVLITFKFTYGLDLNEKSFDLIYNNVQIPYMKGLVKLKLGRNIPKIKLPLKFIRKVLRKATAKALRKDFNQFKLLNRANKLGNLMLNLNEYKMTPKEHSINFEVLTQ